MFDHNYIVAYTDGSSVIKGDFYEASSAVIIIINGIKVCEFGCYHVNGTNSLGELYAMMLAIERIEEIKKENPGLKNYSTYFISDSKYVVSSLNEWIFNWARINKYNNGIWLTGSKSPIMYQWIIKYLYFKYISNDEWRNNNLFIHTNGHVNHLNDNEVSRYYKKFCYRNPLLEGNHIISTLEEYTDLVKSNGDVDRLADKIRNRKLFYYEEREEDLQWEIRKKRIPVRNQKIIIKSRKNTSKI